MIPEAFFAKYAAELGPGRLDAETFRATYTQAIRIVPTRYLQWHGRGEAHDPMPVASPRSGGRSGRPSVRACGRRRPVPRARRRSVLAPRPLTASPA